MSMPGQLEIVVILLVVLLLFGAKRLPEIGRALGQGIREFKSSIKDGGADDKPEDKKKWSVKLSNFEFLILDF